MIPRRAVLAAALAATLLGVPWPVVAGGAARPPIPALPLSIAVAEVDGQPVRDEAWIDAQVAEAARLFGGLGVPLRKDGARALDARYARLETREDRDALAAELQAKKINVLIVESLRDVDDPSLYRMGVHWRNRNAPGKHYVIVAASARPTMLAHEIGHYFGLGHSPVADNVMSYTRTGAEVFLDGAQATRIRSFARMYLGAKLLAP